MLHSVLGIEILLLAEAVDRKAVFFVCYFPQVVGILCDVNEGRVMSMNSPRFLACTIFYSASYAFLVLIVGNLEITSFGTHKHSLKALSKLNPKHSEAKGIAIKLSLSKDNFI